MKTAHRRAHRIIWSVLAFAIPAILAASLFGNRSKMIAPEPVKLDGKGVPSNER